MADERSLMRALAGEVQTVPPVWLMRQAGRYLPEYRAVRERAGDFLSLCYSPDLAAEVTLQPVRRFGLDAAILFADILLVPHALGAELWFVAGEGPRLRPVDTPGALAGLRPAAEAAGRLDPVSQTVRRVRASLAGEVPLIGFAGAPWTVATYMIAGRGTPDQAPAKRLMTADAALFEALMARLTEATIAYLSAQVEAGAEVVKLFDSWAGALEGDAFDRWSLAPMAEITAALKARHPGLPVIVFARGAGARYADVAAATGADCVALDQGVSAAWAARHVQPRICVQGNLDPALLVTGGTALDQGVRDVREVFRGGAHIFNLGHGITPDADPGNVARMVALLREE